MLVMQHATGLAAQGITVNGVAPTVTRPGRTRRHLDEPEFRGVILGRDSSGRSGAPLQVAGQAIAVDAPAGRCTNGQIVHADGAVTASR